MWKYLETICAINAFYVFGRFTRWILAILFVVVIAFFLWTLLHAVQHITLRVCVCHQHHWESLRFRKGSRFDANACARSSCKRADHTFSVFHLCYSCTRSSIAAFRIQRHTHTLMRGLQLRHLWIWVFRQSTISCSRWFGTDSIPYDKNVLASQFQILFVAIDRMSETNAERNRKKCTWCN